MPQRAATVRRETSETKIEITLNLDGRGRAEIQTGIGFLDHLLNAFARHALFDLKVQAKGDYEVDEHHTLEDVAIVLGKAFSQALGERRGIRRMAHAIVPMDEALALVAVDIGGRPYAVIEAEICGKIGGMDGDLVRHFLETLAHSAAFNLHARLMAGQNNHHKAEALFKALGRALGRATEVDTRLEGEVPSTKGIIEV